MAFCQEDIGNFLFLSGPDARNLVPAEFAVPIFNIIAQDLMMDAVDKPLPAFRAECRVLFMASDITDCHIFQPYLFGNAVCRFESLHWGGGKVGQTI